MLYDRCCLLSDALPRHQRAAPQTPWNQPFLQKTEPNKESKDAGWFYSNWAQNPKKKCQNLTNARPEILFRETPINGVLIEPLLNILPCIGIFPTSCLVQELQASNPAFFQFWSSGVTMGSPWWWYSIQVSRWRRTRRIYVDERWHYFRLGARKILAGRREMSTNFPANGDLFKHHFGGLLGDGSFRREAASLALCNSTKETQGQWTFKKKKEKTAALVSG